MCVTNSTQGCDIGLWDQQCDEISKRHAWASLRPLAQYDYVLIQGDSLNFLSSCHYGVVVFNCPPRIARLNLVYVNLFWLSQVRSPIFVCWWKAVLVGLTAAQDLYQAQNLWTRLTISQKQNTDNPDAEIRWCKKLDDNLIWSHPYIRN